jgi:hypothetical protein
MKKNGKYVICSSNYLESDVFTREVRRATINGVSEEASRATGKFVGGILNGGSIRSSSRKGVCHEAIIALVLAFALGIGLYAVKGNAQMGPGMMGWGPATPRTPTGLFWLIWT